MTYQDDLDLYRRGRGYPVADDDLIDLIERRYEGGSFLIINSKCGLFGQRLIDRQGVTVAGIEPDPDRVTAGRCVDGRRGPRAPLDSTRPRPNRGAGRQRGPVGTVRHDDA